MLVGHAHRRYLSSYKWNLSLKGSHTFQQKVFLHKMLSISRWMHFCQSINLLTGLNHLLIFLTISHCKKSFFANKLCLKFVLTNLKQIGLIGQWNYRPHWTYRKSERLKMVHSDWEIAKFNYSFCLKGNSNFFVSLASDLHIRLVHQIALITIQ